MNNAKPIKTKYGILNGRDSIYLDNIAFLNGTYEVALEGELNGTLCSESTPEKWIPYKLNFERIILIKITELDTWEAQKNWYNDSSFDLIEDSSWLAELGGKKTDKHKHYIILTYDDVIEVVCESFKLELGEPHA